MDNHDEDFESAFMKKPALSTDEIEAIVCKKPCKNVDKTNKFGVGVVAYASQRDEDLGEMYNQVMENPDTDVHLIHLYLSNVIDKLK